MAMLGRRNILRLGALSAIATLPFTIKAEAASKITLEKMRAICSDYRRDIFDMVDFNIALPGPLIAPEQFEITLPIDHIVYQNTLNWFTYRIQQEFGDNQNKYLEISRYVSGNYNRASAFTTFMLDKTKIRFYYSKINNDETYSSFVIEE